MVTKHITMVHADKSSMARLIDYITDTQGRDNRVGEVFITNCVSEVSDMAALEMLATQDANTTSEADKTYHAVVSFAVGETPSPDVLREIEAAICDALKMGDHQRVAVAHYDTSCVHMHIALNKIHPDTHTIREPYQDHVALGKAAERLEKKYGLQRTNHNPSGRTAGEREAGDIEAMTGQQSLLSWVRGECLNDLLKADSWERLHEIAGTFGLAVKLRGNGLVFADQGGAMVKGSDVGAEFKKSALEKRLGVFQPVPDSANYVAPEKTYDKKPLGGARQLREEYKEYRAASGQTRKEQFAAIKKQYAREATALKAMNRRERLAARRFPVGRLRKQAIYQAIHDRHQNRMRELRTRISHMRDDVFYGSQRQTWLSWLQNRAMAGREDAVNALRSRVYVEAKKRGADINGELQPDAPTLARDSGAKIDAVTKRGTVIYSVGADAIRDDGHAFRVSRDAGEDTDVMALKLAMQRYGRKLRIHGDRAFQERMLRAAVKGRLYVGFTDPELESRRREMMRSAPKKTKATTQERI
ncbi:MAG: relaxase/mobilization nuclease domain-containing protein [Planctomycetota bacterium]|jgi:hypothetical protein|nr:relaxase/mobilization nuclease domain-containing protein [Planctomycetota bacterium]